MRSSLLQTALFAVLFCSVFALAERGVLVVYVSDVHGGPVSQIEIGTKGDGGSARTKTVVKLSALAVRGNARIPLAPDTKPNAVVSLYIADSPRGHDLVIVSPWDSSVRVPPFENESDNFVSLVVAESGDVEMLKNGTALATITAQILKANSPGAIRSGTPEERHREAIEEVARAFGLPPDDVDKAIREWSRKTEDPSEKALAFLYAKNYPEATRSFKDAIQIDKQQMASAPDKMFRDERFLANSLFLQKQYKQSEEAAKEALNLRPADVGTHEVLGLALLSDGEKDEAIAEFREVVRLKSDDVNGHNLLGVALSARAAQDTALGRTLDAKADRDAAIAEFREIVRLKPDSAIGHNGLAGELEANGQQDAAIAEYGKALQLEPRDYVSHMNLGGLLRTQGQLDGAIAEYRKAIELKPNLFIAHDYLGRALFTKGDLDAAVTEFREVVRLSPGEVDGHKYLGTTLLLKGDHDAGIAELREAVRLGPDNAQAHTMLGLALDATGNHAEAMREIRRGYELDPKDDLVRQTYEEHAKAN
jgi:tetratricopeptide (TPR) repeat protein